MSDTKTILEVDYPKKYAKDIIEVLLVKGEKANFRVIDGAEAVAKITQNESLQIALYAPDGKPFDMSKYVGCSLFTAANEECNQLKQTLAEREELIGNLTQSISNRNAELEALRKDAERYRWLVNNAGLSLGGNKGDAIIDIDRFVFQFNTDELELDAAIDDAIASQPQAEG